MKSRKLGKLEVSEIGFGTMSFASTMARRRTAMKQFESFAGPTT